ncbi:putative PGG domain-containing protein [Rosa chinensis]|uniref:Putative PGG domain-containing protein n=1 Tax=Rosa chinensis TaxID=74649 RepID=A0A2P6QDT3_ROSCH|nr:putative PGG domain-containing protein [Rosa chinensis]
MIIPKKPNFLKKKAFLDFTIADEVALFSSSTAMLMFLFILTSRYAKNDFLKSLPLKLMARLTCLFIFIASMMMAFSTAFYLSCLWIKVGSRSYIYICSSSSCFVCVYVVPSYV